jgi:hypothetical protein
MANGYDLFNNIRINTVLNGLVDPRMLPGQFVFSKRVPTVRALDTDITARFIQYPQIADLVADDSRAVVYNTGKFELSRTKVPNLKIGYNMTQSMLTQISQIAANPGGVTDYFTDWENMALTNLRVGIQQRIELLLSAMFQDQFVYDRLGIKVAATWGMPAPLKFTTGTAWVNIASTPVTDILNLQRYARVAYGMELSRLTMSSVAFEAMIATTEFRTRASAFIPFGFTVGREAGPPVTGQYAPQDQNTMLQLANRVLNGIQIVFYDQRYWSQNEAGVATMYPYLPLNRIIFDNPANDGDRTVWDLANTEVMEAKVASLGGQPIAGAGANAVGPIAYATFPNNLNPPEITYWAVQRCFPRKHVLQANAVIDAGAGLVDTIPATAPF